jgi:polyhydroxyalkanoate synthase subunit PhaC
MMTTESSPPDAALDLAMTSVPCPESTRVAPSHDAVQHRLVNLGPRPLPLFLSMVQHHALRDPAEAAAALDGLRLFQGLPPRAVMEAAPIIARAGRAVLRDYGGNGSPTLFVPSLINPSTILDLTAERSMLRWLATQNVRPLLVDWGEAGVSDRALSVADHVSDILVPLMKSVGEPVNLAGYCLGGTMCVAAACLVPVKSLTLIAAPWNFRGFPVESRNLLQRLWGASMPAAEQLGLLPMEVLQTAFWQLDPERTIRKYAHFVRLEPGSDDARLFVAMEDWANGGSPLTLAAGREMFEKFFEQDQPGDGVWQISGQKIAAAALSCRVLDIVSTSDRIVPAATSIGVGTRVKTSLGHVGMVVGGQAKETLWEPLARHLSGVN